MSQGKTLTYRNNMEIGKFNNFDASYEPRKDFLSFYSKVFDGKIKLRKYPYYKAFCPFHNDTKTPNLSINIISGHYTCFACGASGGYWDLIVSQAPDIGYKVITPSEITDVEALKKIEGYKKKNTAPDELELAVESSRAKKAQEFLHRTPMELRKLTRDRGLTLETIQKWGLGFLHGGISIPIPSKNGNLGALKVHKKWTTEGALNQLYPWEAVLYNKLPYVVLVEGEFDMMVLRQAGINAVTDIFGANAWTSEFNKYFWRKIVYVFYDNDFAGQQATKAIAHSLWESKISVKIPQWPAYMKEKEDQTDFFVKYQKTKQDYWHILNNAIGVTDYFSGRF